MKPSILLIQPVVPSLDEKLVNLFTVLRLYEQKDQEAFLHQSGPNIRGVIAFGTTGISNVMIDALPSLEIVAINGVGTDAVYLDYAKNKNIHVTNTPGVLTDDVADMAIGLLLATLRGICTGDRFVRNGLWGKSSFPLSRKFTGKRVGIVGLGRVGRAIATRAAAFDCRISYIDIHQFFDVTYRYVDNLQELARQSDILILAASADNAQGIIDAEVLDALGPQGVLINVARGKLVNEADLVRALEEKRIAGAGLDVFVDEPNVPLLLLKMENVVLQPHQASATVETRTAMGEMVLANLVACFAGGIPPNSVTA
jgi:lactate dehydrogenase-like 2-hydroxyacid dehydrogenase